MTISRPFYEIYCSKCFCELARGISTFERATKTAIGSGWRIGPPEGTAEDRWRDCWCPDCQETMGREIE